MKKGFKKCKKCGKFIDRAKDNYFFYLDDKTKKITGYAHDKCDTDYDILCVVPSGKFL